MLAGQRLALLTTRTTLLPRSYRSISTIAHLSSKANLSQPSPTLTKRTMSSSTSTDQKAQNHGFTAANQSKWAGKDGHFRRQQSTFRDEIKKGGKFEPELNRYILLVAEACPWAHRTMIVRKLKGMDKVDGLLPCYIVNSILAEEGWSWVPYESRPGAGVPGTGLVPGHEDKKRIRGFYLAADPEYSARCTVPVIWDNKTNTIVNNESSEIIRFMNTCFDDFLPADKKGLTFYPEKLEKEINELNDYAYNNFNNGVYKSGFATSKEAYESSVGPVFETLDHLEKLLSDGRTYFIGNQLTETDIRLYTTAVRFDPVYVSAGVM